MLLAVVITPAASCIVFRPWVVTGLTLKVNVATVPPPVSATEFAAVPFTVNALATTLAGAAGTEKVTAKLVGGAEDDTPNGRDTARDVGDQVRDDLVGQWCAAAGHQVVARARRIRGRRRCSCRW